MVPSGASISTRAESRVHPLEQSLEYIIEHIYLSVTPESSSAYSPVEFNVAQWCPVKTSRAQRGPVESPMDPSGASWSPEWKSRVESRVESSLI